ncbi:ABC transporter substrate-binding protein [Microlunatus sp. GCM10028923]|uniref:ABC transporter substrate-binding protein n=1 Tax=Microlunatus sp. GCM10028923 TaxID=3273400 RepID=UPI00360C62CE
MTTPLTRRTALLLGAGALTAAAGCNRFGGGSATADGTAVNMVWWGDAQRAEVTEAALELYRKANPELKITTEFQSGSAYDDKLAVRFGGGNPPDLLAVRRESLRDFADRGSLLDLATQQDLIKTDDIPAGVLNAGKVGDSLYGVPGGVTSMGWALNKAVFDQYGIDLPDGRSWSWDDLAELAAEFAKASNKKAYGVDYSLDDLLTLGIFVRQHGEDLWTADSKLAVSAEVVTAWFQQAVDLRAKGAMPPPGWAESLGPSADQSPIARGLVATQAIPSNSYATFNRAAKQTLDMVWFPGESQATRRGMAIIPGLFWSVTAQSKAPDQTVALLDFLINDVEANKTMGVTRGNPASTVVAGAVSGVLEPDDQFANDYVVELSKEKLVDPVPDPLGTTELHDLLSTLADEVSFGKTTPKDAGTEFTTQGAEILGKR